MDRDRYVGHESMTPKHSHRITVTCHEKVRIIGLRCCCRSTFMETGMTRKDDRTLELPGVAKRPGRPPTGKAKTPAERKAAQRARLAESGRVSVTVDLPGEVAEVLRRYVQRKNADTAKDPITLADAVEMVLRDRLLRPR